MDADHPENGALFHACSQITLFTPQPIADLKAWQSAAIKGAVAEVFGQAFIVQDGSGRALVDLGPEALDAGIKVGEQLKVEGRLERGMLHTVALTHVDHRTETFGPPAPPLGGPKDWLHSFGTR